MDREVELVNKIIKESIIHGADWGGSYDSNEERLIKSIEEWIIFKELQHKYTIGKVRFDEPSKYYYDIMYQIVPITEKQKQIGVE